MGWHLYRPAESDSSSYLELDRKRETTGERCWVRSIIPGERGGTIDAGEVDRDKWNMVHVTVLKPGVRVRFFFYASGLDFSRVGLVYIGECSFGLDPETVGM